MATRLPPQGANRQNDVRNSRLPDLPPTGWNLFGAEFSYWAAIVSLIVVILMCLIPLAVYQTIKIDKQIRKNEALLLRLEEKEKKNAKPRIDPKPDEPDGV